VTYNRNLLDVISSLIYFLHANNVKMNAKLDNLATMEFLLVWYTETGPTYHIDGNLKFPSTIVQDTGIVNNNVQSLKC
jgi:hypothetical protein